MLQAIDIDRRCLPAAQSNAPSTVRVPAGSWDTHAHVIGLESEWPFAANRYYSAPPAGVAEYLAMLDCAGLEHGVLVQISIHGTDNGCMLSALRSAPRRLRGIAAIDPCAPESTLQVLQAAGVIGLRLSSMGGGVGFDRLEDAAALCAEMGWHLQLDGHALTCFELRSRLARLKVPYSLEHMGFSALDRQRAERTNLMGLLADTLAYVKLSSAFRLSALGPPYRDIANGVRALVAHAPDRVLWGSDWPHVGLFAPQRAPLVGDLLDAFAWWEIDAQSLHRIFVANPGRLYLAP